MNVFDQGSGPPVVVVPGLQGRWEWAKPALRELSASCRAISYSLSGDIRTGRNDQRPAALDVYVRQLDEIFETAGLERGVLCGVSFGGFVALRYAALRPERVSALVLASSPGPGWQPTAQQSAWIARPWSSAPEFVLTSPLRVWAEVSATFPMVRNRLAFFVRQGLRCAAAPMIPSAMAARIRAVADIDVEDECRRISAPTLVVSGEEALDRVVPVRSTRAYAELIPRAEYRLMPRTGHMGLLTQPLTFAEIVSGFAHAHHQ